MYPCGNSVMILLSSIVHMHEYIYNVQKLGALIPYSLFSYLL